MIPFALTLIGIVAAIAAGGLVLSVLMGDAMSIHDDIHGDGL